MKIAIGIATSGRPAILAETLSYLEKQTRQPDAILVCPAKVDDYDPKIAAAADRLVTVVLGEKGLPAQRNALMRFSDADVMVFLDDDFLPEPNFTAEVERLFQNQLDVVVATGTVLADGISGEGLEFKEGTKILEACAASPDQDDYLSDVYNAYGCNMIIRMSPVRAHGLAFDENLPLYAWQEDVDFSRQLAPYGRIVKSARLRGVHLGTKKSGRSPGKRLGYSQIANPIYLARKGTLSWPRACRLMLRNIAANAVKTVKPEVWVDRKGRLYGNFLAFLDFFRGKLSPDRILEWH